MWILEVLEDSIRKATRKHENKIGASRVFLGKVRIGWGPAREVVEGDEGRGR